MICEPKYEIWGLDNNPSDFWPVFREDCFTLTEAKKAMLEWQSGGRAAWIQYKDTGEDVDLFPEDATL